jgi:diguanylate cyclase (GGDEF)-like protein
MATKNYDKEMSLNSWAGMFKAIYFPTQNYNKSSTDILVHLVKVFGGGSRYLFRTHDPRGSREYLAKIFGWYCALANRLEINLDETLWEKYPGVCPRCLERVCDCEEPPAIIDAERLAEIALLKGHERPISLRQWQTQFAFTYRGPSGKLDVAASRERLALVFSRIAEELGEVAEAILLDRCIDHDVELVIRNEMADLGAWIFALANNLQYVDTTSSGITLADITWELYQGKCHRCKEIPCVCVRGTLSTELAEKGAMGPSQWDERTGLANYKAYSRHIEKATAQCKNEMGFWSLISFDLDDFGIVNKTHGNQAGDAVLLEVANRVKRVVANNGIPFRRGGEEFVVVLQKPLKEAQIIAEQIRQELAASKVVINSGGKEVALTVHASFGVASTNNDGVPPDKLEAISDQRTREAKKAGKNRVIPELEKSDIDWLMSRSLYKK